MNNSDFPYIAIWNMHGEVLASDPSLSFKKRLTINNDMSNGRCRNDHGHSIICKVQCVDMAQIYSSLHVERLGMTMYQRLSSSHTNLSY